MAPPCSRVNRVSICVIRPASCMAGGPSRSSTAPQVARANRCCPPAPLWHSGVYCPRGKKCPRINKMFPDGQLG
jgi:hypothetical protein